MKNYDYVGYTFISLMLIWMGLGFCSRTETQGIISIVEMIICGAAGFIFLAIQMHEDEKRWKKIREEIEE